MKKSILRNYLFLSLVFGIVMGILFRTITPFFVSFYSPLLQFSFTVLCVIAGIFVGLFSYWIGKKSLLKTILEISNFSKEVSLGNFKGFLSIDSDDEIGEFVSHYNEVMAKLKDSILNTKLLAIEINRSMAEQKIATNDLSVNTQKLSEKYEWMNQETSNNSQNLFYSISQFNILCHSMDGLMSQIKELSSAIAKLKFISDSAIDRTKNFERRFIYLEDSLLSLKSKMDRIRNSSDEITKTVVVVQTISDKINLLSLNAAIESARAGENGRGFAVVSEEISKLATQTGNSLKLIQSLVKENKNEVGLGMEVFQENFNVVNELSHETKRITSEFEALGLEMNQQIQNQSSVSKEANESIEISNIIQSYLEKYKNSVENTKGIIDEMGELGTANAASAEELSAASEEIVNISNQLVKNMEFYQF
ncbi:MULTISPECIES: methyl-accepting chemotaxis protein [Leptospira]|uniref:Methyl-accepting chemotaxis protein n=1 Tax=Leptospira paudalimensis TaxID=2950024 RepID=A0ABT3M5C9_9LEPT|nr:MULTISPECIES: methyl-accepting chemotaxis protein [Leptospira]MBL0954607.1 methyl-accepting chemotaxis protein [Leptospira sp.]MCW7503609.1 methyl-accepting chemotaxis protein [Leptospira paudalimensis]TGK97276.1 hypothetical protein EHQ34_02760 [Leptospira levettii]